MLNLSKNEAHQQVYNEIVWLMSDYKIHKKNTLYKYIEELHSQM